jgi:hypothetical protein
MGPVLASSFVVCALATIGCSSSSSPSPSPDGGGGTPGTVSFATDVMPIFLASCTSSSACHGQPGNTGEANLYLGDSSANTPAIIAQVYKGLVGVSAIEDPALDLVTPKDAAKSYLWLKLDANWTSGGQNSFASDCAKGTCTALTCTPNTPCGTSMPYLGNTLDPGKMALISGWIAAGAPDK